MPWQMAMGQLANNNIISLICHTKIISKWNRDIHIKEKKVRIFEKK